MSWYPGHMKKALDEIIEKKKMVDVVIEIVDARIPYSTKNPLIDKIAAKKEHMIVLTKKDLADTIKTKEWVEHYKSEGYNAIAIDTRNKRDIAELKKELSNVHKNLLEEKNQKRENFEMKVMVVGMPNVGKSSLLNALKGQKSTKVGNTPGVTKSMQWVRISDNILLLDTPGILMKSKSEENRINNLEILNSIDTSEIDSAEIAMKIVDILKSKYPGKLNERYKVEEDGEALENLEDIGRKRGALIKGGNIDYTKVGNIIVDEFRKGIFGNLTLENVDELDRTEL